MNKLRVFQKVNQRGTVQVFSLRGICTVLLLFLFLPYLMVNLWGNGQESKEASALETRLRTGTLTVVNRTALGKEEIPLELYVADKLSRCMDASYEKEALKAQAVLIRTNLMKEVDESIYVEDVLYGSGTVSEVYLVAAAETKGMILQYEGKPIYGAYFKSSSGFTRDAGESLPGEEYPYLVSVPCSKDYMSEGYYSIVEYSKENFDRLWRQISGLSEEEQKSLPGKALENSTKETTAGKEDFAFVRDGAGYVLAVGYQGKWVLGEELRYELLLASSDFRISKDGENIIIEVTGEGHGFGMSQFTANEMAKEGEDFLSILEYFFKKAELAKIER